MDNYQKKVITMSKKIMTNRSTSILSNDDKSALNRAYIEYHSPYNDGWTKQHYKEEIERIWSKYYRED